MKTLLEMLQEMWRRELGISVAIEMMEFKTLQPNFLAKNYDIGLLGWFADFPDPATFLDIFVKDGNYNWTGWNNTGYEELLTRARHTADRTARFEIFQQAEALLLDEAPITPVDHRARPYLVHPAVQGWAPSALGYYRYKGVSLEPQ